MRSFAFSALAAVTTFLTVADALEYNSTSPWANSTSIKCTKTRTKHKTKTRTSSAVVLTTATIENPAEYTTSTVYATNIKTITSCAPTVTNCPVGSVTTETIALYTTVCPVTESKTDVHQTTDAAKPSSIAVCSAVYNSCIQSYISAGGSPNFADCNAQSYACSGTHAATTTTEKAVTMESKPTSTPVCSAVYNSCIQSYISAGGSPNFADCNAQSYACSGAHAATTSPSTTEKVEYTTSTAYTTKIMTVTSCAPEVTNCPADSTVLVTKTDVLYTTVCPVPATEVKPTPAASSNVESQGEVRYTTSTAYTTKVMTVTSCAPEITNCPADSTSVVTQTVALYTTICPVTATETKSAQDESQTDVKQDSTTLKSTFTQLVSTTVYSATSEIQTQAIESEASAIPENSKTTVTQTAPQNTQFVTVSKVSSVPAAASSAPVVSQISDGQIQVTSAVPAASSAPVVSQISDGQIQVTSAIPSVATVVPVPVVSQISDGQIQVTSALSAPVVQGTGTGVMTTVSSRPSLEVTAGAGMFSVSQGLAITVFVGAVALLI